MVKYLTTMLAVWSLVSFAQPVTAQDNGSALDLESSMVVVKGGSTLHDWEAKASNFGVKPASLSFTEGSQIDNLYFFVEVESMDGGRGAVMNKKINKAFNSEEHPLIEFTLKTPVKIGDVATDGSMEMTATGSLKMAGVTKDIEVEVKGIPKEGGLLLTGSEDMKMSDFDIEQPSAMFGQIVCDDEVTVIFELFYKTAP